MALLEKYYVPGLCVEDHSIPVPLDWTGKVPGEGFDGATISLFYRVVCAPEHVHDDLPLLIFLQGGPGAGSPRPLNPDSDGWIREAIRHFRIILPDQRGTGRSSRVDSHSMASIGSARGQADFLKRFLADSIVRDFEHLRRTEFHGEKWTSLGQSYGGFLTLSYLSLFPQALAACFVTGGIADVSSGAENVYRHTFPRMAEKTRRYYGRYPQDEARAAAVADRLAGGRTLLANGDVLSVERFQSLGSGFGMKPSCERVHWILDDAFVDGDGSIDGESALSDVFLTEVMEATSSNPLYWPLQEFIYANGELERPIGWAAQRVRDDHPEFNAGARPLLFTGEAIFPWMFQQERALRPFAAAVDVLMQDTSFGRIYDERQLERNDVPLQAAVYFDDMYVDSGLQLRTLGHVGRSHYWVTNEFEHDGVHGATVFAHLYREALERGDLSAVLK
ncbi:MAG: alpha/beta fold hydrolase [Bifidobacterium sp.]|jgi:pimeloyl-ACP methyl ester carboxylesterase